MADARLKLADPVKPLGRFLLLAEGNDENLAPALLGIPRPLCTVPAEKLRRGLENQAQKIKVLVFIRGGEISQRLGKGGG